MVLTVTWQSFVAAAAVVGAIVVLLNYIKKVFGWFERQEKQDKEIKSIKDEQALLTIGILACLKGLQEQGCDGAVTDAVAQIQEHINKKAHA